MPSAFVDFRLTGSQGLVRGFIGRSAGFARFRSFSTYSMVLAYDKRMGAGRKASRAWKINCLLKNNARTVLLPGG